MKVFLSVLVTVFSTSAFSSESAEINYYEALESEYSGAIAIQSERESLKFEQLLKDLGEATPAGFGSSEYECRASLESEPTELFNYAIESTRHFVDRGPLFENDDKVMLIPGLGVRYFQINSAEDYFLYSESNIEADVYTFSTEGPMLLRDGALDFSFGGRTYRDAHSYTVELLKSGEYYFKGTIKYGFKQKPSRETFFGYCWSPN